LETKLAKIAQIEKKCCFERHETLNEEPYAGNLQIWFREGSVFNPTQGANAVTFSEETEKNRIEE